MRRLFVALLSSGALFASAVGTEAAVSAGDLGRALENNYIVVLDDSARPGAVADRLTGRLGLEVGHVYRHALRGFSARMSEPAAQALGRLPLVDSVERDRRMATAAQTLPTGINRVDADASPTADIDGVDEGVDVDVAVIDTGIDRDHPDLNVAEGVNCSLLGGILGPILGGLFPPEDDNGHGSHVAGIIGARDNSAGVVGVAPGARVWPVKVLGGPLGAGLMSDVICGVDFVTANAGEIEVANMSLGGSGTDAGCGADAFHQAVCASVRSGVTYAVAAGNNHVEAGSFVPAAYDEVITVSALADFDGQPGGTAPRGCRSDTDDTFANFSNFGEDVDLIAPGVCIESAWLGGDYSTISGTSMASPHAAGAAALYKAKNPSATPDQVKAALQSAGTQDWTWPSEDEDSVQEPLLNVAGF